MQRIEQLLTYWMYRFVDSLSVVNLITPRSGRRAVGMFAISGQKVIQRKPSETGYDSLGAGSQKRVCRTVVRYANAAQACRTRSQNSCWRIIKSQGIARRDVHALAGKL